MCRIRPGFARVGHLRHTFEIAGTSARVRALAVAGLDRVTCLPVNNFNALGHDIDDNVSPRPHWYQQLSGGVPLCDSSSVRAGFRLIEDTVTQHGEQHVAPSSGKSDKRLIVALALLDLTRVIVP